jgi:hypothetical protein
MVSILHMNLKLHLKDWLIAYAMDNVVDVSHSFKMYQYVKSLIDWHIVDKENPKIIVFFPTLPQTV